MNKLFNKIATGIVGIALAIGVGVAVGNNGVIRTNAAAGDTISTKQWFGGNKVRTNAISASKLTKNGNKDFIDENSLKWNFANVVSSSGTFADTGGDNAHIQVGKKDYGFTSITITHTATKDYTLTSFYVGLSGSASGSAFKADLLVNSTSLLNAKQSYSGSGSTATDTTYSGSKDISNGDVLKISVVANTANANGCFIYYFGYSMTEAGSSETTYTVVYNSNSGGTAPTDPNTYDATSIESVNLAGVGSMSKAGFACDGWATSASGAKVYNLGATGVNLKSLADSQGVVTLYAHWYRNAFTVTYNANGGSNPPTDGNTYTATTIQSVNLKNVESMVKTDYACDGWATSASGTKAYNLGATGIDLSSLANESGVVTLYAHWYLNAFTVTYNSNSGGTAPTDGNTYTAATIQLVNLADVGSMSKTGYTCDGWATTSGGEAAYNLGATGINLKALANASGQVTLYAHWTINSYTITYNANSGVGNDFTQSGNYNASVTLSNNMNGQTRRFTRTDYVCDGWGDSSHKDDSTAQYSLGSAYTIKDDITLYAHWKRVYNVNYVAGDHGSGTYNVAEQNPGSYTLLDFASTGITADSGYGFKNWVVNSTDKDPGDSITITSSDITVTAKFDVLRTVSYNANGGTGTAPSSQTVVNGGTVKAKANTFTKSGYAFGSWNTQADGKGTSYDANDNVVVSGDDVVLYARWIAIGDFVINTTNFTKPSGSGSGYSAYDGTRTIDGIDVYSHDVMIQSGNIQFRTNSGWLTNSTPMNGNIYKITLSTTTNKTIYVSNSSFGTTKPTSGTTVSSGSVITGSYKYFAIVGGNDTPKTSTITVQYAKNPKVNITSSFTKLKYAGDYNTVEAEIKDGLGSEGAITFESDDETVATINENTGVVTAVAKGTTTITAKATGATSASFELEVVSAHKGDKLSDALTTTEAVAIYKIDEDDSINYYVTGTVKEIDSDTYEEVEYYIDGTSSEDAFDFYGPYEGPGIALGTLTVDRLVTAYGSINEWESVPGTYGMPNPEIVYVDIGALSSISISGSMSNTSYSSKDSNWDLEGITVTGTYEGESSPIDITSSVSWSFNYASPSSITLTCDKGESETRSLTITASFGGKTVSLPSSTTVTIQNDGYYIHVLNGSYQKVTNVSDLSENDKVIIVADDYDYALSTTQNSNNRGQAAVTKSDDKVTWGDSSNVQELTLKEGNKSGTFAFYTGSGYLYAAGNGDKKNYLRTETTLSDNSSFAISISEGVATIVAQGTNANNNLKYNSSSNLFSCYVSGQQSVSLYKQGGVYEVGEDLIGAVNSFEGTYSWSASCETFNGKNWKGGGESFTSDIKTNYELNNIVANINGNKIEAFLAKYDNVIRKFGNDYDFLKRFTNDGINASEKLRTSINLFGNNDINTSTIVIIVSVASIAAIGGYFFLRKKKED